MWLNAAVRRSAAKAKVNAAGTVLSALAAHQRLLSTSSNPPRGSAATDITTPPDATKKLGKSSGTPTSANARNTRSAPAEGRESRFTRSNNNVRPPKAHGPSATSASASNEISQTSEAECQSTASPPPPHLSTEARLHELSLPHDLRTARLLITYLQRVQHVLHDITQPALEVVARYELSKIYLPAVKGLDAGTVLLLLNTLRRAGVRAGEPVVLDAVAWVSLYGQHLPLTLYVQMLDVFRYFEVPLVMELAQSLPQRMSERDVQQRSPAEAAVLLSVLLPCLHFEEKETESRHDGSASQVSNAALKNKALVTIADLLRARCGTDDVTARELSTTAVLLCAVLDFTASRKWRKVPNKAAWLDFTSFLCGAVAESEQLQQLDVSTAAHLLKTLLASQTSSQRHQSRTRTGGTEAQKIYLTEKVLKHLEAAVEGLTEASPGVVALSQSASGAGSDVGGSTPLSTVVLPSPWRLQDVQTLWELCASTSWPTTNYENDVEDGRGGAAAAAAMYGGRFANMRAAVLTYVAELLEVHGGDVGAAALAAHVARDVVLTDQHVAERARETLPPTSPSSDPATSATASNETYADLSVLLPPSLLRALVDGCQRQIDDGVVVWTPTTVQDAVAALEASTDATHRACAAELARTWYSQSQLRARGGERLTPQDLLAFFSPQLLRQERIGVDAAVKASVAHWSVSEVLYFFSRLGTADGATGGAEGAAVLRQSGTTLCTYAAVASAGQLAALVECFGAAQIRNEEFCEAAMTRLAELLDVSLASSTRQVTFSTLPSTGGPVGSGGESHTAAGSAETSMALLAGKGSSPVPLAILTRLLRSFALMEVRQTRSFLDAAPHVTLAATEDEGSAEEITQLLAAYAKMLVWDYPVFRALAERLCRIRGEDVTLEQLVTAQLAVLRMDIRLPAVTARFYAALTETYCPTKVTMNHKSYNDDSVNGDQTSATAAAPVTVSAALREVKLRDAVMQLSVLSRVRSSSPTPQPDPDMCAALVNAIVSRADRLRVEELAEVLVSLARLGEGTSDAFAQLTVRTLGVLPTAPPRVMAHIAEAYAVAKRGDDVELFTLIAERTIAMRHDMAAITIASVLASFASAGVRHDRLFIEVIPRVRHVATYGTPRDIVNVTGAYAAVNVWHYKLFARLADRAIQLRADFRVGELVQLLEAYAAVQMRYDSLFKEFAPRIQTLAHLLSPADLASIVCSYNQLNIPCVPVWKATASRAAAVADLFTEAEAEKLLDAFSTQKVYDKECVSALVERFPALSSIPFDVENDLENTEEEGRAAVEDAQP